MVSVVLFVEIKSSNYIRTRDFLLLPAKGLLLPPGGEEEQDDDAVI